jgi:hypothetical protein
MPRLGWLAATLALTVFPARTASAQTGALVFFAHGGRHATIGSLSDNGDDLRAGFVGGGGLGLQLSTYVAFRSSVALVDSDYRGETLDADPAAFHRVLVGFDVQTGLPTQTGVAPYVFAGLGWITIDPQDADLGSFRKISYRFGTGFNYVVDNAFLTFFGELGAYLFNFDQLGFDRHQFDLTITAGIAYAIPF